MVEKCIILSSTKKGSGKSVIAIGTYLKLKEAGHSPGYFKPIGDSSTITPKNLTDKDVSVISAVVARKFSKEQICPQYLNPHYFLDEVLPEESPEILEKIKDAFNYISNRTDIVIIEGNHNYSQYKAINLDDLRMAKVFNASLVLCAPISDDNDIHLILSAHRACEIAGVKFSGVILSPLTKASEERVSRLYIPLLKSAGIQIFGGLKNSKTLEKPTIAEILDTVDGKLLAGDFIKIKNKKINGFVIGAMQAEKALTYIQQDQDYCVITGGDRTDIALNALEVNIGLIVFTGNLQPQAKVLEKAKDRNIPVILASGDTFTITQRLQTMHTEIQTDEIQTCYEQVDQHIDWEEFTGK